MRAVAFRHVPFEGLGLVERALESRGIEFEYADLYRDGSPVPDVASAAALIFLGGPMSVNDDLPFLRRETQLIREAMDRDQPLLGICLGSQLIARALGAKVERNAVKEIGWFDVSLTDDGRSDSLFRSLGRGFTVFHWHSETFEIPQGAIHLASSQRCRNQAFRMGQKVYGLQFHLEVTPDMIASWSAEDENCGDVCELEEPLEANFNAEGQERAADAVFGSWCDLVRAGYGG